MIKVWVLIAYLYSGNAGGPFIIDNIATQQDCERVAENVKYMASLSTHTLYSTVPTRCVEVRKIK